MSLRRHIFTVATFLVAIAVVVNFARPAPIVLEGDDVDAAYLLEEVKESGAADSDARCPCPTEIEKTDCDEGLCSFGLTSGAFNLASGSAFSHDPSVIAGWHAASTAPDPDPPRFDV
ncbi:MAG: hypothetical protein HEP70_03830 [Rhodobiaceae bacterium]|nr:hypothetical protein [Rhodobiaceae bacterium]